MEAVVGVLTVSDSCFRGEGEDRSGPNLKKLLTSSPNLEFSEAQVVAKCVPDEVESIQKVLLEWVDDLRLKLILTSGGTGFSPRDVTPEATKVLLDKEAPGLVIAMLTKSLEVTTMSMLSRPVCGIRKGCLIINLPGSKKASEECFGFVLPAIPHALDLLSGRSDRVKITHTLVQASNTGETSVCPHGHLKNQIGNRSREDFYPVAKRPRHSPYPLLSVEDALKIILQETSMSPQTLDLNINECLHCVLAADVTASQPLPPFPASIKDGYAVISSDGVGERQVLQPVTAGEESSVTVMPGTVARITTGAPVPEGADAVVMVENTKLVSSSKDGSVEKMVDILLATKPGQDIRPVGSDVQKGETVLEKGTILGSSEIGIAAAVGVKKLNVFEPPQVAVLSTGNEVVDPGDRVNPGQIYDSNRYSILSMLKERNCTGIDMGIARDTREALVQQIREGFDRADVIITTGGVSMGEKDLLKPVLEKDFGAKIHFGRVFMKPGKPTTFASLFRGDKKKLVFALPGNPVSAMVTFELFVFPALKRLSGWNKTTPTIINAKLSFSISLDPRPEYQRVKLAWKENEAVPIAETTGHQISSRLLSMRGANGLLMLPPRDEKVVALDAGETVKVMLIHKSLF